MKAAAGFDEAVDGGDVRVVQRGEELRFALEARDALRVGANGVRQRLDGDVAPELGVPGAVHLAHAPAPMAPMISYGPTRRPWASGTVAAILQPQTNPD